MSITSWRSTPVKISIQVPRGPYGVGDPVEAHISLASAGDALLREVSAQLVCEAFYKAANILPAGALAHKKYLNQHADFATDKQVIATNARLGRGLAISQRVTFHVPTIQEMPTYYGKNVHVHWLVKITCNVDRARDAAGQQEIIVVPTRPQPENSGPKTTMRNLDDCDLTLSAPRAGLALGETVEGELKVQPRKDFKAQELRADLVCGQGPIEEVEQSLRLAGETQFYSGRAHSYGFQFKLPSDRRPTITTSSVYSGWVLKAKLSRNSRSSDHVELRLIVYTPEESG